MKSLMTLLLAAGSAAGFGMRNTNKLVPPPLADENFASKMAKRAATTGQGTFDQLIDHADPSLGTFSQRYWWSTEFYGGADSPLVLFTPGESAADGYTGYLTNETIVGLFAQAVGGATLLIEHRYWGTSSPFDELTTKNMQYLTLSNSIYDLTYFAKNVALPFAVNGSTAPGNAPWVLSGGSYSGALTAWVESVDPGTFWAYHASSAVVEAIGDFWQYFAPEQEGMPKNCSADVQKVVEYVDGVLTTGTAAEKDALKMSFGLGGVEHDDDFASALENGPWQWQGHDFYSGYSGFFQFCDYVENAIAGVFPNASAPGAQGVGLEKALNGYQIWTKDILVPGYCAGYGYWTGEYNLDCFDTYNASSPLYTDISLDNAIDRSWNWFLCNEPFKFWQDGAPEDVPTIVSRLVDAAYWERQCGLFFPPEDGYTYGIAAGKTTADVNAYTGGWFNTNTTRLTWTNGEWDPWKDATVSSDFRPGGPLASTPEAPVHVIQGGIHCSDLLAADGEANAGARAVQNAEIETIKTWVEEFYVSKR